MKQRTKTQARPEYTIVDRNGVYKVFDKNQHFRCSFGTRAAAQGYIDQRTGKAPAPVKAEMTQAAVTAA